MLHFPTISMPVCYPAVAEPPFTIEAPEPICPRWKFALQASAIGASWVSSDNSVVTVDHHGLITGVTAGTATITASVNGQSATVDVTVSTSGCPVLLTTKCCCTETATSFEVAVGTDEYSIEVVSGALPLGFAINGTAIEGTTTVAGLTDLGLRLTDSNGATLDFNLLLSVVGITTVALPDFTIGTAYGYQLEATGGTGVYAWEILNGLLPDGLSMTSFGIIHGIPTEGSSGTPLVIRVRDVLCEELSTGGLTGYQGEPITGYQGEVLDEY
jgi:hypothetical protein